MYNDDRKDGICHIKHTPSSKQETSKQFVDYLLHQNIMIDRVTNTARCAQCGERLAIPYLFLHPAIKFFYLLLAAGLECVLCFVGFQIRSVLLIVVGQFLIGLIMLIAVRLTNAAIFTFGAWEVESETSELLLAFRNDPRGHRLRKFLAIYIGMNIVMGLFTYGDFYAPSFYLLLFALVCAIMSIIYKKTTGFLLGSLSLLYATAVLVCYYVFKIDVSIVDKTVSVILLFTILYTIIWLLDSRRGNKTGGQGDGSIVPTHINSI